MTDTNSRQAFFEVYLSTAEKVSERRAQANSWLLSVNSALVGLYGVLQSLPATQKLVWTWAIPLAGVIVCVAWARLLASYRKLNAAKFRVLQDIEKDLPVQLFADEQRHYRQDQRRSFSDVELWIPGAFGGLYLLMLLAALRG